MVFRYEATLRNVRRFETLRIKKIKLLFPLFYPEDRGGRFLRNVGTVYHTIRSHKLEKSNLLYTNFAIKLFPLG